MSMMIRNKEGKAITIGDLDKEAAIFWKKPLGAKTYANPMIIPDDVTGYKRVSLETYSNWFDVVGRAISNCNGDYRDHKYEVTWPRVIDYMLKSSMEGFHDYTRNLDPDKIDDETNKEWHEVFIKFGGSLLFFLPFIQLIRHWEEKGYTPVQVIE